MSARRRPGFARDTQGATAVETALVVPVFALFLLGIAHLGWALHCGATVQWALERSARRLLLDPEVTEAQLRADVAAQVARVVGERSLTVTLTRQGGSPGPQMARATADYQHPIDIPFLPHQSMRFQAQTVVPLVEL